MKLTEYGFELIYTDDDNLTIERFKSVKLAHELLCVSKSEITGKDYETIKALLIYKLKNPF